LYGRIRNEHAYLKKISPGDFGYTFFLPFTNYLKNNQLREQNSERDFS
jgi:hypothetical protein